MSRRNFLTRSGLALGALLVGDEVLEAMDRLSHRKVWAGHTFGGVKYLRVRTTEAGQYFYVNRALLNALVLGLTRANP